MKKSNVPHFKREYLSTWMLIGESAIAKPRMPCFTCGRNLYNEAYADLVNKLCIDCKEFYELLYKKEKLNKIGISYSDFINGVMVAERLERD